MHLCAAFPASRGSEPEKRSRRRSRGDVMAGPQRGLDYAPSDPGGGSGGSRKRLRLKKRFKCSLYLLSRGSVLLCNLPLTHGDQPRD